MRETIAFEEVKLASDEDLAKAITTSFHDAEASFRSGNWKHSGNSSGHFVEAIVRFLEFKDKGSYTQFGKPAPKLNPTWLASMEAKTKLCDSYRFHVPRVCLVVYGMRNKKGYGHLSLDACEKFDAVMMLDSCRWILSEIVMTESKKSKDETEKLIQEICERPLNAIWKVADNYRLLRDYGTLEKNIIVLLYHLGKSSDKKLAESLESTLSYVKKLLRGLHKKRLVEYTEKVGGCELSPLGITHAEQLIKP